MPVIGASQAQKAFALVAHTWAPPAAAAAILLSHGGGLGRAAWLFVAMLATAAVVSGRRYPYT